MEKSIKIIRLICWISVLILALFLAAFKLFPFPAFLYEHLLGIWFYLFVFRGLISVIALAIFIDCYSSKKELFKKAKNSFLFSLTCLLCFIPAIFLFDQIYFSNSSKPIVEKGCRINETKFILHKSFIKGRHFITREGERRNSGHCYIIKTSNGTDDNIKLFLADLPYAIDATDLYFIDINSKDKLKELDSLTAENPLGGFGKQVGVKFYFKWGQQ